MELFKVRERVRESLNPRKMVMLRRLVQGCRPFREDMDVVNPMNPSIQSA